MAKKKDTATADLTSKPSEPDAVDAWMAALKHPHHDVLDALRILILSVDKQIGEQIKWNAPTFFYTGPLRPSDPKEFKRIIIVSNVFKKDCIRLVFWQGARCNDTSGLLEGDYADGRRLATFTSVADVNAKEKQMRAVIKTWIKTLDR